MRFSRIPVRVCLTVAVAGVVVAGSCSAALGARADVPNWPYIVYRPANLSKVQKVPLLVYPAYGDVQAVQASENFDAAADRLGFVVVWAEVGKSYNDAVRAAGDTEDASNPYPDMQYLGSVIDKVSASENIDPARVFMTGMSAAGTLSYRAACVLSNKLTAIAPVEAVVENQNCHPARPVSVFAVNGTADPASPYNGLNGLPSVASIMNFWKGADSCSGNPGTLALSSTSTASTWTNCRAGSQLQFVTVNGGGHGWPAPTGIARFDATTAISNWFMSLPGASSQPAVAFSAKLVSVTVKAGTPRKIIVHLGLNSSAAGNAALALGGKTVYSHAVKAANGSTTITLAVPARLRKGTYRLAVSLSSASGGTATLRRAVHLPG
ncbi:MAG TPA: PHB depolymerase family esterase [Gaiellaceae bacterium]|nr:PHB depolymerase family esterase [Gaiellaceae bacterium]